MNQVRKMSSHAIEASEEQPKNYFEDLYRPFLNQMYRQNELKSQDLDIQQQMANLSKKSIDYDKVFQFNMKNLEGSLSNEDRDLLEKEQQIIEQKYKEAEKSKVKIDFFNKHSNILIQQTSPEILYELGIRSFVGSRDVPQDNERAIQFIQNALQRAIQMNDQKQIELSEYFLALIEQQMIQQLIDKNREQSAKIQQGKEFAHQDNLEKLEENNNFLQTLALKGIPEAIYTQAKEIFQRIHSSILNNEKKTKFQKEQELQAAYFCMINAAAEGIHSSYFFLALMTIEGLFVQRDFELGLEYLYRGASKYNPYCYFYLALLYNEGIIVPKNPKLEFLYLQKAAEEGFVQMQHSLGVMYYEGRIVQKNDKLALSWLRESIRNGYYPSYLLAGDILFEGNVFNLPKERSVEKNRIFALGQYLGAYQNGALFLEYKIKKCLKELIEIDGFSIENLPVINFAKPRNEEVRQFLQNQQLKNQEEDLERMKHVQKYIK